ncbi:MAG TPA: hypothetical protein VER55_00215 [Ardenticatenaceae bacterium]|nr:hypothetical protein [Ardenticatenaceae bacterium]
MTPIANKADLEKVVGDVQRRWGPKALHKGVSEILDAARSIPTGFQALDHPIGGGLPRGHVVEFTGAPTSGIHTLALHAVAALQTRGETAAYLDLGGTFDPEYAARCGVVVPELLLLRPKNLVEGLEMSLDLVTYGAGILVWDSDASLLATRDGDKLLSRALQHLRTLLAGSQSLVVFLAPGNRHAGNGSPTLGHHAALSLHLQTTRWLRDRRAITGYEVQARLLRNRGGPTGGRVTFSIHL